MTKISKKIGKMWKDTTGVSPIIAVILMVAITVVLAATIYVWVSGFGGSGGTSASVNLAQTNYDGDH
ncbi:MAG TPA: type IV pilin, partial [Thermoplasmatales archaeon]|nr:type IV pilin [Thermoplasmatales archaeon]